MIMCESWFRAFVDYPERPEHLQEVLFENKKGFATCYCTEKQFNKSREDGKRFFDEKYRRDFTRDFLGMMDKFTDFYNKFKKMDLPKLSDEELLKLLSEFYSLLCETNSFFKVSGGRVFPVIEQKVKTELAKHYQGSELEKNYGVLLTPISIDVLQREEAELLDLASKQDILQRDVENHADKYALHFYNTYDREQVYSFIKNRIQEARKSKRKSSDYLQKVKKAKQVVENQQKHILSLANNEELAQLSGFLRQHGSLRFELKNYWSGAEFRFLSLFEEIAKRIEIPLQELFDAYRFEDVEQALVHGKKLDGEEVSRRKDFYTFYKFGGKEYFFTGEDAEKAVRDVLGEQLSSTELKGTPANPGYVQGKVRIVSAQGLSELQEALRSFQEGEVLITTMTQPNMIFLMKKACAIVTDQGGMTSHAAVVSRELGIPCVVGTQFATRTFKNGDLIIVDANNGIVRKIKGG